MNKNGMYKIRSIRPDTHSLIGNAWLDYADYDFSGNNATAKSKFPGIIDNILSIFTKGSKAFMQTKDTLSGENQTGNYQPTLIAGPPAKSPFININTILIIMILVVIMFLIFKKK